jgi:uncharacterized membrane protein
MSKHPAKFRETLFQWMANPNMANLASQAQAGEVVMDKLPFLPARIAPLPLAVRALAGGGAGAAAFVEANKPVPVGWVLGAASAVASSFLFYNVRKGITGSSGLPDLPVALAEDGLVLAFENVVKGTYEG